MELRREQENRIADQLGASGKRVDAWSIYALPDKQPVPFMLLDQDNGSTWQVQWGLKPEERLIRPVEAWAEIAAENAQREQAEKPAAKRMPPPSSTKPKVVVKPPLSPK
ncbi:MAG: hypothetical protein M3O35_06575 [Acidobacteriota bacterium]|nr:hypothetical protein [Acidobacteriota bacterium]